MYQLITSFLVFFVGTFVLVELLSHVSLFIRIRLFGKKKKIMGFEGREIDALHIIRFAWFTIPYYVHGFIATIRLLFRMAFPSTRIKPASTLPIEVLLETSLIFYVRALNQDEKSKYGTEPNLEDMFVLDLKNFRSPSYFDYGRNTSLFIIFNAKTKETLSMSYNGIKVTNTEERIGTILMTVGTTSHSAIHGHMNKFYEDRKRLGPKYDHFFWQGSMLNEYAYFYPGMMFHLLKGPSIAHQVLNDNVDTHQPPHHNYVYFQKIQKYSKYVNFCVKARPVIFELVKKFGINVDPELLFLNTVVHSLDHYGTFLAKDIYITPDKLRSPPRLNMLIAIFFHPMRTWKIFGSNYLVEISDRDEFHKELYTKFEEIDSTLSKWVAMSVSF